MQLCTGKSISYCATLSDGCCYSSVVIDRRQVSVSVQVNRLLVTVLLGKLKRLEQKTGFLAIVIQM